MSWRVFEVSLVSVFLLAGCNGNDSERAAELSRSGAQDATRRSEESEPKRLLGAYAEAFNHLLAPAGQPQSSPEVFEKLRAEAQKLGPEAGEFSARFQRLLDVSVALVKPVGPEGDPAGERILREFMSTRGKPEVDFTAGGGATQIAAAVVEEVVDLHVMLESSADRHTIERRYFPKPE